MSKDWLSNDLWRAHVSWLTQEWIGKTQDGRQAFNAVEWIDNLQRAKYDSLIFYLKHHDGNCTFKSRHDATEPPERDFYGECVAEAHKRGMRVMAYYSSVLDYELALQHEDWRVLGRDGKQKSFWFSGVVPGAYLCINNPEYRQLMLNQIQEILDYGSDGVWIDVYSPMSDDENCFCPSCRKKYHAETGSDIFDTTCDDWYEKCYVDFLREMNDKTKAYNPECVVTVNQRRTPGCLDIMDFYTTESDSAAMASIYCRSLRDGKKPYEITYRMYTRVGSWSMKSADVIKLESATIIAHGGACSIEIAPTNTGFFQKDAIDTLEKVGSYIQKIGKYCVDTQPLYDAAYLLPEPTYGVRWYWDSVLAERDVPFRIAYRDTDISKYQLVILDPMTPLDEALAEKLEAYVKGGGSLIVECNTGACGSKEYKKLMDVLGLESALKVSGNIRYLGNIDGALKEGVGNDPLIVENVRAKYFSVDSELDSPYYSIIPTGARPLAFYNYACGDEGLGKNVWYRVPPAIHCSDEPAITVNQYGKGKAMFLACPLVYSELNSHKKPDSTDRRVFVLQFASNLVRFMMHEPLLRPTTPAGVEVVVNRQGRHHIVHVLNHYLQGEYYESRNGLLKLAGIKLSINGNRIGAENKISTAGDGGEPKEIPYERDGKWIDITLPELATNEILIIE